MKKFGKLGKMVLASAIALGGLGAASIADMPGTTSKASAATGIVGKCGASVWTDASTYNSGATTVDWQVTKPSTQCGTVYYSAKVYQFMKHVKNC
jgi:hypothetical protein